MSDKHTVYHPVFPDVSRDVATDEQREAHKAAGWRMTPIPADKGGSLPEGVSKVTNDTGKPERVVEAVKAD